MIKLYDNQQLHQSVEGFFVKNVLKKLKEIPLNITLDGYIQRGNGNTLFSFFDDESTGVDDGKALIAKVQVLNATESGNDYLRAETGNYIGKIRWSNNLEIDIASRFSDVFLRRMINFANDIYIDDIDFNAKQNNEFDSAKFILYYLFVQALEKAYLLGLPKTYRTVEHHEVMLKGRVNINGYIRHDMPYKGKISSTSREQVEVTEIVDVLYQAITIISSEHEHLTKRIKHITPHLKQARSTEYVSNKTILRAKQAKSLQNPIFEPYKRVLKFAETIIGHNGLLENSTGKNKSHGFLINVAELFEVYIRKLLTINFPEWHISSPKLAVYKKTFFNRNIIPDIVMEKKNSNDIMVFDTKYKRMNFTERRTVSMGDVDRNDFFQIHTYLSYYLSDPNNHVLAAGLLYPLSGEYKGKEKKCISQEALGDKKTLFVIDGIELKDLETGFKDDNVLMSDLEERFIKRVKGMIVQGIDKRNR